MPITVWQGTTEDGAATSAPRKIAIVGKSPSTMQMAPFDDPSWEIWSLADGYEFIPRCDVQVELHDFTEWKPKYKPGYFDAICRMDRPVVVQKDTGEGKNFREYPLSLVLETFQRQYFNNSISYMIAMAILEGAVEIGMYGVDMAQNDPSAGNEYAHQRPSCEYMIGICDGRGIPFHIPPESLICKCTTLYAFGDDRGHGKRVAAQVAEMIKRRDHHQQQASVNQQHASAMQGAIDALNWAAQH